MVDSEMFTDITMELLERGHSVKFRAPGRSMHPTIRAEETITVEPIEPPAVKRGDIILYRIESGVIAHRVIRIEKETTKAFAQSSMTFDENRGQQNRPLEEASLKANRQLVLKPHQGRDGPQDPQGRSSSAPAVRPPRLSARDGGQAQRSSSSSALTHRSTATTQLSRNRSWARWFPWRGQAGTLTSIPGGQN